MDRKSFEDYTVEDFITDESFINYHFRLNETDRLFWEEWLTNNPSKKPLAEEARQLIQSLSLTITEKEYQEEFKKIEAAINKKEPLSVVRHLNWDKPSKRSRQKKSIGKYMLPVLAIIVLVSVWLFIPPFKNQTTGLNKSITSLDNAITFTLSDSTVVTLAPHSILQFASPFEGKDRQVYLEGEASFHVKRNEQHPFKVHTKNIVATVLGTIFNITKPGDSAIVIRLLQGRLKVETEDSTNTTNQPLFLYPDEKAVYVFHDRHFFKKSPMERFDLSFHQDSFEEIATQIKNSFGVTLINQSNKKDWRFTGQFKNASIKEIIEYICFARNLTSKTEGDTIFIQNLNH